MPGRQCSSHHATSHTAALPPRHQGPCQVARRAASAATCNSAARGRTLTVVMIVCSALSIAAFTCGDGTTPPSPAARAAPGATSSGAPPAAASRRRAAALGSSSRASRRDAAAGAARVRVFGRHAVARGRVWHEWLWSHGPCVRACSAFCTVAAAPLPLRTCGRSATATADAVAVDGKTNDQAPPECPMGLQPCCRRAICCDHGAAMVEDEANNVPDSYTLAGPRLRIRKYGKLCTSLVTSLVTHQHAGNVFQPGF